MQSSPQTTSNPKQGNGSSDYQAPNPLLQMAPGAVQAALPMAAALPEDMVLRTVPPRKWVVMQLQHRQRSFQPEVSGGTVRISCLGRSIAESWSAGGRALRRCCPGESRSCSSLAPAQELAEIQAVRRYDAA